MATTTTASKRATKSATDVFTCPECGKTFTRAAALGAHRKMTHGVAGASANAASNRTSSRSRKRPTVTAGRTTSSPASNGSTPSVNRDALLRTVFPNGIPPRQDVITQVNAWLDEAERLARGG
jgi:hypothetical protein